MRNLALMVWVYGGLVLIGGAVGYLKAKSRASLFSGGFSGVLLLMCGWAMWQGRNIGLNIAAGIALALLAIMGGRFISSRKFMPAGLIAILSAVVAVALLMTMFR